jgi:hypothetical protein
MAKKPAAPPVDYTPKPPQQVLDQIAAADQLRADMGIPADSPPVEEAPPQAEAPPQPEGTPSADAASTAQPPQPAGEEQSWEQRHRSLQGRYETLQRNYQQQGERIGELEKLISTMRMKGAEEPPSEPPPKVKPKFVTEQEATEYGEELLTVIGKRAKEEYFPEFDELAQRLKRLEGRVDGVGTVIEKTQVNDVYASLNGSIPEWKQINRSDDFKAWLELPDPYSGRIRHDMLQEAFSRHEGGRVVSFFRGFLTEAAGLPPDTSSPGSSAPQPNGSGKPSLEDFAAPGRARSAPQNLPPDKPIYTAAWIAKFTADKIAGKYRGREEDADAIEQDIYRAQHEGRIQ